MDDTPRMVSIMNEQNWHKEGQCPTCGAPVYLSSAWTTDSASPPPSAVYTCECRNRVGFNWTTTNPPTVINIPPQPYIAPWIGGPYYVTSTTTE
jgi:hypothetical protein